MESTDTLPADAEPAIAPEKPTLPPAPEEECGIPTDIPGILPTPEPAAEPDPLHQQLEAICDSLAELRAEFAAKLRYDEGRQVVIDRQYQELERFRKEEADKHSRAIVNDVICTIDTVEKNATFYEDMEPTPENFAKLLRLFNGFSEDLRDILENNDIFTYRSEPGSEFNAKRQRVLKTIPTADAALDKAIAHSLRWGFETIENRVIRHELVAVHVYKPDAVTETPSH